MPSLADIKKQIAERQAANTNISNQYVQDVNAIVDKNVSNAVNKVQGQIDSLPIQYQSGFDANAVQQKINERQTAARMSDLGLTNSGLNRTQQTAIAIQRSNADAALRQQMNAATFSLKQQIADLYASAESQKAETAAQAKYNLQKETQRVYDSMMDSYYSNLAATQKAQQESEEEEKNKIVKYIDEDVEDELRRIAEDGDNEDMVAYVNSLVSQGYPYEEVVRWIEKIEAEMTSDDSNKHWYEKVYDNMWHRNLGSNIAKGLKGVK